MHQVETKVENILADRLLRLPPVPPHAIAALADQWEKVADPAVPPPTHFNLTDLGRIAPTPVLMFREDVVEVYLPRRTDFYSSGYVKTPTASARLSFDYKGNTVTHATAETLLLKVTESATIQFQRDLTAESQAFARLAQLGLKPIKAFPGATTKAAQTWDFDNSARSIARPLYGYFAEACAGIASRWLADHLCAALVTGFVEIEPDSLSFDVEPSGIDWFDISLGARIDGKPIDILPLLRRMLEHYGAALLDHPAETLSVEIAQGKLAQIPMEKIKPVLQMLLQFASHDQVGNEKLRLPARDLAALADFESGTQHTYSLDRG